MRSFRGSIAFILLGLSISFAAEIDGAKFRLAEKYYNQKNYLSAISGFRDLIQNYPFSAYLPKAAYFTARSYFETRDYVSASRYFSLAEKKSVKDADKRLSLFGLGESQYRLGNWKESAVTLMSFGIRYKDSPAAPAALNYSALSLEALNLHAEAKSVYQSIVSLYPSSPYYAVAQKKLGMIENSPGKTNAIDISDNALNVIDLNHDNRNTTNLIVITNTLILTNSQSVQPVSQLQLPAWDLTNAVIISNQLVVTQKVMMLDTNELILQKEYRENQKREEEIDRFRSLIELKAKLLEIKERTLEEKKNEILENPDQGTEHE